MAETTTEAKTAARKRARRRARRTASETYSADDLSRLKRRIQELEDQLSRTATDATNKLSSSGEKVVDAVRESLRKSQVENVKLFRGFTEAYVEGLGGSVRAISDFLDGVSQRDRLHGGASVTELSSHFLEDLADGIARAIETSTESRTRMIDKFYRAYKRDEPQPESSRE
jgi:hypothetical protein